MVIISFYQFVCSAWFINLTKDTTGNPRENSKIVEDNEPHLRSQLKGCERVLTKAIRERNNLQDANIRLVGFQVRQTV